jgi:NifU-like protein
VLRRLSNKAAPSKLDIVRSELFTEQFLNPQNVGAINEPEGLGEAASFECGGIVRLSLSIDANKRIAEAKFKAIGCHVLVASASLLTDEIKGKTTAEAAQLARSGNHGFGSNSCLALVGDALLAAISRFSDAVRDEWIGDEALICSCFGVSESEIERRINQSSLRSIEEVTSACNAGAGCRSCYPLIQEIIDTHWREKNMRR